jgi:hypothetical protein
MYNSSSESRLPTLFHRHPQDYIIAKLTPSIPKTLDTFSTYFCPLLYGFTPVIATSEFDKDGTMSFFGFDTNLPRDHGGHNNAAPGFSQAADPFAGFSGRDNGDDVDA